MGKKDRVANNLAFWGQIGVVAAILGILVTLIIGIFAILAQVDKQQAPPQAEKQIVTPEEVLIYMGTPKEIEAEMPRHNLIFSMTSEGAQNAEQWLYEGTGLTILTRNCISVLQGFSLIDPVPIDVVNKHYKILVGKMDEDNLQDSEYNDLGKYPEAIYLAWKEYYGDRSPDDVKRTSFNDIVTTIDN